MKSRTLSELTEEFANPIGQLLLDRPKTLLRTSGHVAYDETQVDIIIDRGLMLIRVQ